MVLIKRCVRCRRSVDHNLFIGVRGYEVQACAPCRGKAPPAPTDTPLLSSTRTRSPPLVGSRSRSPPSSTSTLTSPRSTTAGNPGPTSFASASSVITLEQRVEQHFGRLEQHLDTQFRALLTTIRSSQAPPQQPALTRLAPGPPPLPLGPPPHPHLAPTDSNNPPLCCLTLANGQLTVVEESADSRTSAFVKAIPSIAALTQVWVVYVAIRSRFTGNIELNEALLAHLEQLIEFDHLYSWRAVADYHLAVCRQHFGTTAILELPAACSSRSSRPPHPPFATSQAAVLGPSPPLGQHAPPGLHLVSTPVLLSRAGASTPATLVRAAPGRTRASTAREPTPSPSALPSPANPWLTTPSRRQTDGERHVAKASIAFEYVSVVRNTLNVFPSAPTAPNSDAAARAAPNCAFMVSDTTNVRSRAYTAVKCVIMVWDSVNAPLEAHTAFNCASSVRDTVNVLAQAHAASKCHPLFSPLRVSSTCHLTLLRVSSLPCSQATHPHHDPTPPASAPSSIPSTRQQPSVSAVARLKPEICGKRQLRLISARSIVKAFYCYSCWNLP
ncbi:uncharacterized protein UBRO_20419 [Ustilago bromivora]|uniref:Uncharacterized protein n=1 Tax=Ustilago bromivora TaxID=307758 RepID=A0A1K0GZK7_9BASI|nr:uncharacterized protein UBRO_20419 [Ustilago bromivora]